MQANVKSFMMQSVKQQLLPLFIKCYSKVVSGCSTWTASTPYQISSWSVEKSARKRIQEVLLCADLVTFSQGQDQWKQCKIVEVKGAYKHGRHEKMLKCHARWPNKTNYIDPYVAHMDGKKNCGGCLSMPVFIQGLSLSSHLSCSLADRWGITKDFTTSFLHSSQFSAFRSMIFHSRPVHSLMSSSHCFLCLPLRLPPWTVCCRI